MKKLVEARQRGRLPRTKGDEGTKPGSLRLRQYVTVTVTAKHRLRTQHWTPFNLGAWLHHNTEAMQPKQKYWPRYFSFCWQRRCKKLAKQLLNRVDCTTILGTLAVSVAWHPKTLVPLNWHISSVFNQNSGALNIVVGIGFPLFSESFEILLCQC